MPPRNNTRSLLSEDGLADRLVLERERRGWTYEGLAKRMTDVGCTINQSAIYKIEKGQPRRRITVDELVALSHVLEIPIEQLLLPPKLAATRRLAELFIAWDEAREAASAANAIASEQWELLVHYVADHEDVTDSLDELLTAWAERLWPSANNREAAAYWLAQITKRPEHVQAFAQLFNEWAPQTAPSESTTKTANG